jgi:hypothetical protein
MCVQDGGREHSSSAGHKNTQLNLNLSLDPAATVYEYHTKQKYLTHLPNNFGFALLFIVVVEYICSTLNCN